MSNKGDDVELTVVMPCLNEAETVATCVRKAVSFLREHDIDGEVLVADNGSTDGSQQIALAHGAKVVMVDEPGYGAAIRGGVAASSGRYVIMGDADESYDFGEISPIVERLRVGRADLLQARQALVLLDECQRCVRTLAARLSWGYVQRTSPSRRASKSPTPPSWPAWKRSKRSDPSCWCTSRSTRRE